MRPTPDWPVDRHATLDSTSDEARRRVEAGGAALPFVVRTDRQTKGRGRGSNRWWSDEGSLLFTVALDPAAVGLELRHQPRLALVTALAVIEAASEFAPGLPLGIRWPNDVEAGGRKLAGILPERVETAEGVRLLVGVGINVTTRFEEAPEDVRGLATSLVEMRAAACLGPWPPPTPPSPLVEEGGVGGGRDETPTKDAKTALLDAFLAAFAPILPRLARDDPALALRWQALDQLAGRPIRVRQGDRVIAGIGREIDAEGALILVTDRGLETMTGGQVLRNA